MIRLHKNCPFATQGFRGHTIQVSLFFAGRRQHSYTRILSSESHTLRRQEFSPSSGFFSAVRAADQAFGQARTWVNDHPLAWPY